MSMPARLRPMAIVAALALGAGLSGCANYETLNPYQPAAGVVTNAPGMKVRNLMLLANGSSLRLGGTLLADQADSLQSVQGVALKTDGTPGTPLTVKSSQVTLPANQGVELYRSNITATGDVKAGGMANVTLKFAKAGEITITTPVLDAKAVDISTAAPSTGA